MNAYEHKCVKSEGILFQGSTFVQEKGYLHICEAFLHGKCIEVDNAANSHHHAERPCQSLLMGESRTTMTETTEEVFSRKESKICQNKLATGHYDYGHDHENIRIFVEMEDHNTRNPDETLECKGVTLRKYNTRLEKRMEDFKSRGREL